MQGTNNTTDFRTNCSPFNLPSAICIIPNFSKKFDSFIKTVLSLPTKKADYKIMNQAEETI